MNPETLEWRPAAHAFVTLFMTGLVAHRWTGYGEACGGKPPRAG